MSQKRVLVTGAAGFIGFHLCQALIKRGDEVIGIDNFNDYYSIELKRDRAKLLESSGMRVFALDVAQPGSIKQIVHEFKPTHLIHLAAQAGVRLSLSQPERYHKANLDGFLQILEACRSMKEGCQLIYASSSSVYGHNQKVPFSIHDTTDAPANIYGVTKKANELMAFVYHKLYKIPSIGLRFFTVYGPWGRPDMAYFSFTKAIFEGKPIDLYNFGNMKRDFTYIDDIIQGILACFPEQKGCKIYNLGNCQPESLDSLVELIERETGKKAIKNLLPLQPGEMLETYADIEDSKRDLQFQPKTRLSFGIRQFVQWYRSYYQM